MPRYDICLLFSDTGGGHRSATEAIAAGIRELLLQVMPTATLNLVTDNIVEKSHFVNRWFVSIYNYLLRYHQAQMKYYHRLLQTLQPNNTALGYMLVRSYLIDYLKKLSPSTVVSIHPMANHFIAAAIKDAGLSGKTKMIVVVTDPNENLWSGWACDQADLIIAPNELARNCLVSNGIPPQKIRITGMPIHPDFTRPPRLNRQQFLTPLGLDPEKFTVCINAGWAGGGNMLEVFQALQKSQRNLQTIFLCGHNQQLYVQAQAKAAMTSMPTVVLPFNDSMSDLMGACDLMVTKAGGLTTFESIARKLPIAIDLIDEAMPQEKGTAELLINQRLALALRKPVDIVSLVDFVFENKARWSRPLPKAYSLDRVDAVFEIARIILNACNSEHNLVLDTASDVYFSYSVPSSITQ